jgi:hypothetical protein
MRKMVLFLVIALSLCSFSGSAGATIYQERFLFGSDGESLTGWYAGKDRYMELSFDLGQPGNTAKHIKAWGPVLDTTTPVQDESGFVPGTSLAWAKLNLELASVDPKKDPVMLLADLQDKQKFLYVDVLELTSERAEIDVYLPNCIRAYLQNTGTLNSILLSPTWMFGELFHDNGFILHEAELSAAVPEPSTLLLLGSGLAGLLGFGTLRKS